MKKYNGTAWVDTTLRQYKTATADIEPTIYTDGTAITSYTIKGNTMQNGTPTPDNPVDVVGVGTLDSGQYKIPISSGQQTTNIYLGSTQTVRQIKKLVLTGQEDWLMTTIGGINFFLLNVNNGVDYAAIFSNYYVGSDKGAIYRPNYSIRQTRGTNNAQINIRDDDYITLQGFKIYLANQYANGTPVIAWYVLATPETATVNEPLQKIGDYADTLSNATAIPTTEGANSITFDTTVQPSEFTATWTGWHNANVKKWNSSQWD